MKNKFSQGYIFLLFAGLLSSAASVYAQSLPQQQIHSDYQCEHRCRYPDSKLMLTDFGFKLEVGALDSVSLTGAAGAGRRRECEEHLSPSFVNKLRDSCIDELWVKGFCFGLRANGGQNREKCHPAHDAYVVGREYTCTPQAAITVSEQVPCR